MINTILLISNIRAASNKKIPLEEQAQGVYELCVCTATRGGRYQNIKRVQKGAAKKKFKLFFLSMLIDSILFSLYN